MSLFLSKLNITLGKLQRPVLRDFERGRSWCDAFVVPGDGKGKSLRSFFHNLPVQTLIKTCR